MQYFNRLLTDNARKEFQPTIDLMWNLCPDMMSRKIPEANVQQAFVFKAVVDFYSPFDSILSVGCFEDTAYASLVEYGYDIIGIDPMIDGSTLDDFFKTSPTQYNIIFSTSVIEHVKDDEQFIDEICKLLKPGGYAILTTDFRNDYTPSMPLPYTDVRFYTEKDLSSRLESVLERNGCSYVGDADWTGKPDFLYQGHKYSFATLVFRKDNVQSGNIL